MTELEKCKVGAYDKVDLNALAGEGRDKIENYTTTCEEAIKKGLPREVTVKGAADNVVELTFALNCFFGKIRGQWAQNTHARERDGDRVRHSSRSSWRRKERG